MTSNPPVSAPRRLWLYVLIGCAVAGALDAFQSAMQGLLADDQRINWQQVIFQGSEWLFLALLTPLTYYLGKQYPLRRAHLFRSLAVHAAGALLLCCMWASLGVVLRRALGVGWGDSFLHELRSWTLISLPWSFFMYFALLGTFAAFGYYVEARDRELQATQLTVQLSDARLRALGAQLQPHFLFNTLNAITVLLRDRRAEQALSMLDRLSDMLHQVLRTDRPHEIALQEELELVRRYLEIEQVRFSDRLQVKYDIDDAVLRAIVPRSCFSHWSKTRSGTASPAS